MLDKFRCVFYTITMKKDKIIEDAIRRANPNFAADRRKFTKAARHCGMSRNRLKEIYMEYWCTSMSSKDFAKLILQGRLVYAKDALGKFYGTDEGRNWYHREDGTTYYFRGQYKGRIT